ncbi:hypothetical protein EC988_004843 [Linderina pennispora]|nr:hypothetical protein EC988_004843 [Linderina pennispora]
MNHHYSIPQYLLERGDNAREYRRRRSSFSRSSISSDSPPPTSSGQPKDLLLTLDDERSLPTADELQSFDIESFSMSSHPSNGSSMPNKRSTVVGSTPSMYYSTPTEVSKLISPEEFIRVQRPRNASITAGQRFGIAKPKIINF